MRRAVVMLTALLGSVIFALGVSSSAAWAAGDDPAFRTVTVAAPAAVSVTAETAVAAPAVSAYAATSGGVAAAAGGSDAAGGWLAQEGPDVPGEPTGPEEEEGGSPGGRGQLGRVVSNIYSGIHLGLIVALAALGLSLIFGTTGLINFSHGELVSFGAIMALVFNVMLANALDIRIHLIVATVLAVAVGALFGYLQDVAFWGWLRRRGTGLIAMMIISIGVALLLRYLYLYLIGPNRRLYADFAVQRPLELGPLAVPAKTLITDAIALLVLVGVAVALMRTRMGKAIRAVADNPSLAAASGINVDRVTRLVWAVGAGLAALAGVFLAMHESVNYLMGFQVLLLIFAAVVVGGLGTAFGAVAGGVLIGLLVQLSTLWVPSEFKYVVALVALIVVLLVRPQGLLGRRVRIG